MSKPTSAKLKDLVDNFDNQRAPLSVKQRSTLEKKFRYYGAQGVIDYVNDYIFDGEYILVAEDGENLKSQRNNICNHVTGKFWVNNHAHIIRATESHNTKYLYYALNLVNFRNYVTGSAQPKLTKDNLGEIVLHVHTGDEQKKIADVISSLDKKIELNNRINVELEAMAKTLYDYWFVQFDFPDANGKPYKTTGGKMVYNPTLKREIPKGWSDGTIGDVIGKVPQATKVPAKEFQENGKVPVIDQSQTYICGFTDDETATIEPESSHVIFGDHTRAVKLVNFDYARGADGTQVLVAKSDEVPSYLLYQIVADIDLSSYGYARHYKFLKESKCVIPRTDISKLYQVTVVSWYEAIRTNIFQNYELQRIRDWLLPMLMNGQVTVK